MGIFGAIGSIIGGPIGGIVGGIVDGGGAGGGAAGGQTCYSKGVTNAGLLSVSTVRTALAAAMSALNVKTALDMAKLQKEIAGDYAKLAEDARNYYNEEYKPLESETLKEVDMQAIYLRDKDDLVTGQMLLSVRGQYIGVLEDKISCTGRYCTGQRAAMINDGLLAQANAEASVAGMAFRFEDARESARNTLRWERRREVLNLGRDIPTKSVAYAELAAGIFGSIGKQAGTAAEGIAGYLGHQKNRRDTEYPERPPPLTTNREKYEAMKTVAKAPKPAAIYNAPPPVILQ